MNETQSLVTSIGEFSLSMIGKDHIEAVKVMLDVDRNHAVVTVALRSNESDEQLRTFEKFMDVEQTFFEEVSMELRLSDRRTMADSRAQSKQLAYFAA